MSTLSATIEHLLTSGSIPAEGVIAMRKLVFGGDCTVSAEEAEGLFALDECVADAAPEWRAFFLEAMTDYVVRQQAPEGYVDAEKAKWLVERVTRDGRLKSATELELLVRVLEAADSAPPQLSAFVIRQVARAAAADASPISKAETEFLRRVVFACGGAGGIAVTKAEAAALFDLNDAAKGRANDPAWGEFFARAVANAILYAAPWTAPDRDEALKRDRWLKNTAGAPTNLQANLERLGRLFSEIPNASAACRAPGEYELQAEENAAWAADLAVSEQVTEGEAEWLIARIGKDGGLDDNEKALLRFLKAEAGGVHPALQPLIDKAA